MYSVLIADDEKRICSLIRALIDWEGLGLQLAGTASNGREALEIIRESRPDIIITDVRMPEMDGIELLRCLNEDGLTPKVIIISGYAEFEYAHAAIQYGVQDYLLKPIQKEELNAALQKISAALNNKDKALQHLAETGEQLKRSRETLRNQVTQMLVEGRTPELGEEPAEAQRFRLVMFLPLFQNRITLPDAEKISSQAAQLLEEPMRELMPGIYPESDKIWCLIRYRVESDWERPVQKTLDLLTEKLYAYGEVKAAVSGEHRKPAADMTEETLRARCWQWRFPLQSLVYHDELPDWNCSPQERKQKILEKAELLDADETERLTREYAKELQTAEPLLLYSEMLALWTAFCDLPERDEMPERREAWLYGQFLIGQSRSDSQVIETAVQLLRNGIEETAREKEGREDHYVRAAKKYIRENLHETITLESVSSVLHISPTYLSALFTQKADTNFKDFVTTIRIQEAKEMIKTRPDLSISQIGTAVGYPDQQYFSKLLSKVVGVKPSQYRKLHQ